MKKRSIEDKKVTSSPIGTDNKSSVSMSDVKKFKDLDSKRRSGKMSASEFREAKDLALKMKRAKGATNDIAWYSKYPELLRDASNVIFNEVSGTEFVAPVKAPNSNVSWPVVGAKMLIVPTIGRCFSADHPFNYQMRDLWLQLHRAYRGIGTYEYADLGIALYSIMMTFADIARAERVYAIASKFVAQNRSYPNIVISALGLDPAVISAEKLADYRYQLNRAIAKASVLCLPKGFSAFELYIRLFGNVFKDSENIRAQWFLYDSLYRLDYDPTFTTGSSIKYSSRTITGTGGYQTLDDIIGDINTQLDNLLSDTDVARMCSDILKAFGENGVQTLYPVPEGFTIDPVDDEVRLLQMHNTVFAGQLLGGGFSSAIMTALGSFTNGNETLRIYQEGGVVHQRLFTSNYTYPVFTDNETPSSFDTDGTDGLAYPKLSAAVELHISDGLIPLNCWKESPSGDDIVEMTRQTIGHNILNKSTSGGTAFKSAEIDNYSAYVVGGIQFFVSDPTYAGNHYVMGNYGSNYITFTSVAQAANTSVVLGQVSKLDWAPRFNHIYVASGVPTIESMYWDMDNYTLISKVSLSRLHDACVLSLFKLSLSPIKE